MTQAVLEETTTSSSLEKNLGKTSTMVSSQLSTPSNSPTSKLIKSDVLLNTFQIKKKRYRVLLNNDHIVWEAFEARKNASESEKISPKETEYESEQLSNKAAYGHLSNVVHINEIIRVNKGTTKNAATRVNLPNSSTSQQQTSTNPEPIASPLNGQPINASNSSASTPLEQYLCIHYAERIVASSKDCNRWRIRSLTLFNNDPYLVRQWHSLLNEKLQQSQAQRIRKLLVFINPYGGRKQGLQQYENYCKNLFLLAGIDPSCIISQRANQIRDILLTHDLSQYDAICCVGGDGTVAEVINGLIFRAMSDHNIDFQKPSYIPKPTLPVGIIPAGSTDTIAYSLHGTSDVRTAAIHLILGQRRGLDISSVRNTNGIIRFCASVLSYGYLGDVAAKSEKYRWMGTKRYEYTGVKAFLLNRGYEAELRILLADDEQQAQPSSSLNVGNSTTPSTPQNSPDSLCVVNCQRCSLASNLTKHLPENRHSFTDCHSEEDEEKMKSFLSRSEPTRSSNVFKDLDDTDDKPPSVSDCDINLKNKIFPNLPQEEGEANQPSSSTVSKESPKERPEDFLKSSLHSSCFQANLSYSNNNLDLDQNWKTIKGSFFMISGANITCACSRSPNGISRFCHLGDGYLDLILVRKTTLLNNVKFLLNTVGRNGDIKNLPFVEVYRTRQFSFRAQLSVEPEDDSLRGSCHPITEACNNGGDTLDENVSRWNCDGEVVNDLDLTMTSHCQLVDVFMRGPYAYEKRQTETKQSFLCCCRRS